MVTERVFMPFTVHTVKALPKPIRFYVDGFGGKYTIWASTGETVSPVSWQLHDLEGEVRWFKSLDAAAALVCGKWGYDLVVSPQSGSKPAF